MQAQEEFPIAANADTEVLSAILDLLPPYLVNVRKGVKGAITPFVRSIVDNMVGTALEQGFTIDRTNGEGPLSQWDGWLVIETPTAPTFLQIAKAGGRPLEP